jgi:hypothetical protein
LLKAIELAFENKITLACNAGSEKINRSNYETVALCEEVIQCKVDKMIDFDEILCDS